MRQLFLLLALFLIAPIPLLSQDAEPIVLQLAMPDYMTSSTDTRLMAADFEAEHPGIQVHLVPYSYVLEPSYLDDWKNYLSSADVVYVESDWFDTELSKTNYLLNLEPLYSVDSLGSTSPQGADSFVWEAGRWAIATGLNPILLSYDTETFTATGLTPPTSDWTLSQLEFWANSLKDSTDGEPIFIDEEVLPFFLRYILQTNLYDATTLPLMPDYQVAELPDTINLLRDLQANDLLQIGAYDYSDETPAPIRISHFIWDTDPDVMTMLPVGIKASGFAASRGTAYPDLAYELISFIAQSENLSRITFNWPIYGTVPEQFPPIYQEIMALDYSQAVSYPETLFASYLAPLLHPSDTSLDAALTELEHRIETRLYNAAERQSETLIVNATEPRTVPENGISLRFAVMTNLSPLPTEGAWNTLADEFIEANPDIAEIIIEPVYGSGDVSSVSQLYDCFYSPYNLIPNADFSTILPLSPLMVADPDFNPDDFVAQTLEQLSHDDEIWAFPMDIQPLALWVSADYIESSGLAMSDGVLGASFFSTLQATEGEESLMVSYDSGGDYLLLLIYGLDGMPFDYSVYPPAIHFTDPATIEAVRSLIGLIDAGKLSYLSPLSFGMGSGTPAMISALMDNSNTRSGTLVTMSDTMGGGGSYNPYLFPHGENFTPISYELGAAYLSASSPAPEACYRFLSFVSREPGLFGAMPARQSVMDDARLTTFHPEASVAFYRTFAQAAQSPETIVIPSYRYSGGSGWVLQYIFYRGFDLALNGELELEAAMQQAADVAEEYQACAAQATDESSVYTDCYPQAWLLGE